MQVKKIFLLLIFNVLAVFSQEQRLEVFFDFNQHHLNNQAIAKLNSWIVENGDPQVSKIYGFCDWVGSNPYNDTLSLKRVDAVFQFLKNNNISIKEDYLLKGFGKKFEQSKNQAENRKVIIIYEIPTTEKKAVAETVPTLSQQIKTAKTGEKILLENIHFYNNSARVVPKSQPILYDLLCIMEENPNLRIEIQGHICCQTEKDVRDISTARARFIYNFLLRNKISRKRLAYKGYGISKPIHPIPEQSEKEEDENRRVEILILEN